MARVKWADVLAHAAEIVRSYSTGVTLRQLFYRLVVDGVARSGLPNTRSYYQNLSHMTSLARQDGAFPELLDQTSRIRRFLSFSGPAEALTDVVDTYRRDRTEGQPWTIFLGVEKAGLATQLSAWFGEPLGLPITALGGYASQTLCSQVAYDIYGQGRRSVLIYAGDMDSTGEDIDRDFERRVGVFDEVVRVGLSEEQVLTLGRNGGPLPFDSDAAVSQKLERDSRAARFKARHRGFLDRYYGGELVQFEVDAIPPDALRNLYQATIDGYWDADAYDAVMERESDDLVRLRSLMLDEEED